MNIRRTTRPQPFQVSSRQKPPKRKAEAQKDSGHPLAQGLVGATIGFLGVGTASGLGALAVRTASEGGHPAAVLTFGATAAAIGFSVASSSSRISSSPFMKQSERTAFNTSFAISALISGAGAAALMLA